MTGGLSEGGHRMPHQGIDRDRPAPRQQAETWQGKLLHQLFEEQMRRTPDAVAIIHEMHRITYCELDERAEALASTLRNRGVGPETLVGICLARTPRLIVSMLAVLKAGGAYVPLDPSYPLDRLIYILNDAEPTIVLVDRSTREILSTSPAPLLNVDEEMQPSTNVVRRVRSISDNNLAYILYTSGSTGRPKGVALTHSNAASFLNWVCNTFSLSMLTRVLAGTSISFDLSILEIFAPLAVGGAVVLVLNILRLPSTPARNEITMIQAVPSAMAALMQTDTLPQSVSTVLLGGEPVPGALVQALYEHDHIQDVWNLYGPTEAATYAIAGIAARNTIADPPIGVAISNALIHILDENLFPVAPGMLGELYIGGTGVARGYHGQPGMTAECFVPDMVSISPGTRLYRTGDLGRYNSRGVIEYLGRIDQQIKLNGFRIELGEIEAILRQHPQVYQAVVLVGGSSSGTKHLVAIIMLHPQAHLKENQGDWGKLLSLKAVQTFTGEKLPRFMIPRQLIILDELPLTSNGKIDRRLLESVYA